MFKLRLFVFWFSSLIFLAACGATATPQPTATSPSTAVPISVPTATPSTAELNLVLPTYADNTHLFYIELLQKSLDNAHIPYTITLEENLPQNRAVEMLDQGQLSLMWLLASEERDSLYTRVNVGLTNGLIGQRILLLPPGQKEVYAHVKNLADFRDLGKVGAFGKNWFDTLVWANNDLPYQEIDGEWRVIYDMMAEGNRNIDYFSRGFTEILNDAHEHPDLEIEPHLVLIYDRDFYFYLSSSASPYKEVLEGALLKAQTSGLIDELVQKYWADNFAQLHLDQRIHIQLETPK